MSVKVRSNAANDIDISVYKQQRSRQLNDGTFERRTHSGYEGAKELDDKGELFGVHNIFRFQPEGFVKQNVSRIVTIGADMCSSTVSRLPKTNCARTSSRPSMSRTRMKMT